MKFKALAAAVILVLSLSGCSTSPAAPQAKEPASASATPTPTQAPLSESWEVVKSVKASTISKALFSAGFCKSEPAADENSWADTQEWTDDTLRVCFNYKNLEVDSANLACPATFYVNTDANAGKNASSSPNYEDGYDLALFSGKGWEISVGPSGSDLPTKDPLVALQICKDTISAFASAVGGTETLNKG